MPKEQIFIFTAAKKEAQIHLEVSIRNQIPLPRALENFPVEDHERIKQISESDGLFAWGAIPGDQNIPRWNRMAPGDWVLCVYDNYYHYLAQVIEKYNNKLFAREIWREDPSGQTWEFMYFLTRPKKVNVPVGSLTEYLNVGYRGFFRISDEKLERIEEDFNSISEFLSAKFEGNTPSELEFSEIPDGITAEDVLGAIHGLDSGIDHRYHDSTGYDLIHEGRTYPPKAVIGLAARRVLGRPLRPHEFKGGEGSKNFRVLRQLGFEIIQKQEKSMYILLRSNADSPYHDKLGSLYHFTSNVPNYTKLLSGAHIIVDSKTSNGVRVVGFGELNPTNDFEKKPDGVNHFEATFKTWTPIDPPNEIDPTTLNEIKTLPKYNAQHAIRIITQDIYEKLAGQADSTRHLCLLGTWSSVLADFSEVKAFIDTHGAWASWWSFVLHLDALEHLKTPFYLYANSGSGNFPVRLTISEFIPSRGNEGIPSPWPDITRPEWLNKNRIGPKQSELFKTWFKVTKIDPIDPPLKLSDFTPATPWSNDKTMLNQNAFGYTYLKSPHMNVIVEPYTIDDILEEGCFLEKSEIENIRDRLKVKKNIILQGPPGTGKTWLAKRLAFALIGQRDHSKLRAVQFHPNLSYEDFVRGWRPSGNGVLSLVDGVFMEAVEAARRSSYPYVVVIEEINRGNPAQIFGEMLTLLEADRRSPDDALELCYQRPDRQDERVYIPENLYVIGTMNIADRSLALVDLALRRRFAFVDLEPRLEKPWRNWLIDRCQIAVNVVDEIEQRMGKLNKQITEDTTLGSQFRIGHSYVTPPVGADIGDAKEWFKQVVKTEIGPLLDEYWFDSLDKARDAQQRLIDGL